MLIWNTTKQENVAKKILTCVEISIVMKKLILFVLLVFPVLTTFGQIRPPQQTDTIYISSVKYNYADIRQENWPCSVIYKSTTSFMIGEYEFTILGVDKLGHDVNFVVTDNEGKESYILTYIEGGKDITIKFSGYEFICRKILNEAPAMQEGTITYSLNEDKTEKVAAPFQLVDEKPSFQGGDANAFSKWVNQRLIYPKSLKKQGIQGRVTLQFTIQADGSVSNVKVLRGVHPELDQEAVRVIASSPKWIPGKRKGNPVPVTYTFPVIFQAR